jgi:4-amino-4-deoxychorismate lyase
MAEASIPMLVNGVPETRVPIADRGFQYGDGLFETIAVTDGRLEFWGRHMARLAQGCGRLGLPAPDAALLRREAERLCAQTARGVLKIMVTRGIGGRGYRLPDEVRPTRVLSLHPAPDYPADVAARGVQARVCETRLAIQPRLAGLKHMNRLEQILARAEWREPEITEGLMLDTEGAVIEGTMTNLFAVGGRGLRTPDLSSCGVAGIVRAVVLDLAREMKIPCRTERLVLVDVLAADEIFLTNSVIGIWPVARLGDKVFGVGEVTRRLAAALANAPKD